MAFDLDEDELRATRKMNKADRNDIEVGEYVRTNKGNIGQVIGIFNGHCQAKYHIQFQGKVKVKRQYLSTHTIIKHSKQLIDLIEVGDIVNDYKVLAIKDSIYENSKRILIYKNEKERYERWIYIQEYNGRIQTQDDIVIILTKEQFEANCYKVGGEDESTR